MLYFNNSWYVYLLFNNFYLHNTLIVIMRARVSLCPLLLYDKCDLIFHDGIQPAAETIYGIRRSLNGLCSITVVKLRRARFIIGWVTAWDCQVLYTFVGLREPRKSDGSSDWLWVGRKRTTMDVGAVSVRRDPKKSTTWSTWHIYKAMNDIMNDNMPC